jgi:hypothetical protein
VLYAGIHAGHIFERLLGEEPDVGRVRPLHQVEQNIEVFILRIDHADALSGKSKLVVDVSLRRAGDVIEAGGEAEVEQVFQLDDEFLGLLGGPLAVEILGCLDIVLCLGGSEEAEDTAVW